MPHEKVVAVYDTAPHADTAVSILKSAGYSANDISVIRRDSDASNGSWSEPGFWRRLFGYDIDPLEAKAYSESLLKGGVVVWVRVPDSESLKVIELLSADRPVDALGRARIQAGAGAEPAKVIVPPPTSKSGRDDEEVVRLAEEQLSVGKRQVQAGITRVRRFMVEKPVEASVSVHEERAEVMRSAISDASQIKDIDWSDRTIEVTETVERPVVNKTVRVVEEVIVRRKSSDHVETVHDTVRRQELEVKRVPVESVKK